VRGGLHVAGDHSQQVPLLKKTGQQLRHALQHPIALRIGHGVKRWVETDVDPGGNAGVDDL
jgi:hypothetical protein